MLELAVALKRENPDRTAAQVARILRASGGWSPSESTLLRLFHRRDLMGPAAGDQPVVFGRFEAAAPNERWVGDALHGPRVGGRKTYLFAFLDDHSRLAVGYRFGFAEDTVRLAAALQPALAARGVPASCYVDNGSAYVDSWLLRACGKLGIRLIHSTPHRPQGRGKIERWFRGVREQFLVEVADTTAEQLAERGLSPAAALLELNALFTAWVESVYHHRVHSETGQTPLARWDDGWQAAGHGPAMASARGVDRGVPVVAVAHRHQDRDGVAARQHLPGRTGAGRPQGRAGVLPVQPRGHRGALPRRHYGRAVPHRITRHAHPKARPETPEPAPAPATGIAYLQLVADAHHQQVAAEERIGFHALYSTGQQSAPDSRTAPGAAVHRRRPPRRRPPRRRRDRRRPPSSARRREHEHPAPAGTTGVSPGCRSAAASPRRCCTATTGTPKPSPGSAGASTSTPSG